MKKVYIETLGCSKNLVDSEQMLGVLDDAFELANDAEEADIVIVNTCSFIHDAKEESIQSILDIAKLKQTGHLQQLLVTGCLSQRYPDDLLLEIPEIDAVVGTSNFYQINEVISEIEKGSKEKKFMQSVDLEIPEDLPRILTTPSHYAFLKIAEGCDNRCTYCIIPKLRGKYRSRRIEDIIEEAKDLVDMGVKELILIAQDTSRYGIDLYGEYTLAKLLDALNEIEQLKWIRVHYLYPDVVDHALIDAFFRNDKVIPYFDIPIQHGSDSVLKRMNRRTSKQDIINLVEQIRAHKKHSVIRTTVIVGFPGETEDEFNELLEMVEKVRFDRLGAFVYSDEEGTPAFKLPGKLDEEVKEMRRDAVMSKQMAISEELSYSRIGSTFEVIIEEVAEENKIYVGRSAFDAPDIDGVVYVHHNGPLEIGAYYNVVIKDALEYDLIGEVTI